MLAASRLVSALTIAMANGIGRHRDLRKSKDGFGVEPWDFGPMAGRGARALVSRKFERATSLARRCGPALRGVPLRSGLPWISGRDCRFDRYNPRTLENTMDGMSIGAGTSAPN